MTDPPEIIAWGPGNFPKRSATFQAQVLRVTGRLFGSYLTCFSARVGGTSAENTIWESSSSLSVRVASGIGRASSLVVSIDDRISTLAKAVTYDAALAAFGSRRANFPASGRVDLSVFGQNFGAADHTSRFRIGHSSCEASFWRSDSSVLCRTPAGLLPDTITSRPPSRPS
ncbi:hypothetical protein T484DRAFT_1817064 [Baffinella frigidus]|nr:hypothetical protein T484DRAFT_1817064 [Cryptophyta sp. CCMP2293]